MTTEGEVKDMLSGSNLERSFGNKPEGEQGYQVQTRVNMLMDGKKMIGAVQGKYGTDIADYGKPLFEYIKTMTDDRMAKKVVLMATFLGEINEEINRNPARTDELRQLKNNVTEYYQDYMNKRGKEISAGALLRLYRDKYMGDLFAETILEEQQIRQQKELRKLQDIQDLNKEIADAAIEEYKKTTQAQKEKDDADAEAKKDKNEKAKAAKKKLSQTDAQKMAAAKMEEIEKKGGKNSLIDKIKKVIDDLKDKCK